METGKNEEERGGGRVRQRAEESRGVSWELRNPKSDRRGPSNRLKDSRLYLHSCSLLTRAPRSRF